MQGPKNNWVRERGERKECWREVRIGPEKILSPNSKNKDKPLKPNSAVPSQAKALTNRNFAQAVRPSGFGPSLMQCFISHAV